MNDATAHLSPSADTNLIVAALASLDDQKAAAVKYAVDYVNCQQDPAAALHELVRGRLETLQAEPGMAA